jgi:hypothetical protein
MARKSSGGIRFEAHTGASRLTAKQHKRRWSRTTNAYTLQSRQQMRDIIRQYEEFCRHLIDATPEIIQDAFWDVLAEARYLCPKDTGRLRESAYNEILTRGQSPKVEIGFGRNGEPHYTALVHEDLMMQHQAPTQAKFLQTALETQGGVFQGRIIDGYLKAGNFAGVGRTESFKAPMGR